jgi:hypothetical protein
MLSLRRIVNFPEFPSFGTVRNAVGATPLAGPAARNGRL